MNTQVNAVDEAANAFKAVLKTLKDNKVMVDTRKDGIYIRLADGREGGAFTLHWANVFPFKTESEAKQQLSTDIIEDELEKIALELFPDNDNWTRFDKEVWKDGYRAALQTKPKSFTEAEILEIIRFAIYGGTPEFYEQGGVLGTINFPKGETYAKAKRIYEQYIEQLMKAKNP